MTIVLPSKSPSSIAAKFFATRLSLLGVPYSEADMASWEARLAASFEHEGWPFDGLQNGEVLAFAVCDLMAAFVYGFESTMRAVPANLTETPGPAQ
ncbi:hypothetical protein D2T29_05080 [Sinirhodobacter populi]|uniref:Uncharacterized protein n=1 Tax=Paenirhodobacter populi TaxID=2306993 RepID=A0A443KNA0_9RHOB|nr:hypothetical protein D2T29_05080 [Sinirhodobacter populi]